jgi:hypothetical protein
MLEAIVFLIGPAQFAKAPTLTGQTGWLNLAGRRMRSNLPR